METVDADLQNFLHYVVHDEQAERHFTQTHEVVPAGHVSYQAHCLELPRGQRPASGRKLNQQPDMCIKLFYLIIQTRLFDYSDRKV